MAWGLSSWLGLTRCVQIIASLIASGLHGFLFGYLAINKLGMAQNVVVLQFMMTAWFAFVVVAFSVVHTRGRSRNTTWLVATIAGDICFVWVGLAIITLLSHAGVPTNCAGLTRPPNPDDETLRDPAQGYTSIRFTNQWNGAKGELDRYCALERIFYGAALVLTNLQIVTVILSILRICQGMYIKKTKAAAQASEQVLHVLREADKLKSKSYSQDSAAPGGGIRDAAGFAQQQHHHHGCDHGANIPLQHLAMPPSDDTLGVRPPALHSQVQLHHHHHCQHHRQQQPLPSPVSPVSPQLFASPSGSSSGLPPTQPRPNLFTGYDSPEEEAAAAALVTDGSSRSTDLESGYGSSSGLPPYTPGRLNPMSGHGDESNEMRLSDYVKGETRAQHMKNGLS